MQLHCFLSRIEDNSDSNNCLFEVYREVNGNAIRHPDHYSILIHSYIDVHLIISAYFKLRV